MSQASVISGSTVITCRSSVVKVKSRLEVARETRDDVFQHDFSPSSERISMGRMEMLRASLDNSHSEGVGEVHSWPGVGACYNRLQE